MMHSALPKQFWRWSLKSKIIGPASKDFVIALVHSSDMHSGGASRYETSLRELLTNLSEEMGFELRNYYKKERGARKLSGDRLSKSGSRYSFGLTEKFAIWMIRSAPGRELLRVLGRNNLKFERRLKREGVDLVYFASPNAFAMGLTETPFITTVWDLGHRDLPQYPEMSARGRWELREEYYRATVPKSLFVVTDSVATGRKLQSSYGLSNTRWIALGLLPQKREVREHSASDLSWAKEEKYIYYPSHKWAHKNHRVLLQALERLKKNGTKVKLVLTGVDKGSGKSLNLLKEALVIEEMVVDLGFRSEDEVTWLMANSLAVVMPSVLGPTNYPPLEAQLLGVPAIVSDAHFFDEPSLDSLIIVSAHDPKAWATEIERVTNGREQGPAIDLVKLQEDSRAKISGLIRACRTML